MTFQSLFWWIGLSNGGVNVHAPDPLEVSILVLVDRPLKPTPGTQLQFHTFVSILVLVDRPLKRDRAPHSKPWLGTVSILVLVDRPLKPTLNLFELQAVGSRFNPCSGGSASQTPRSVHPAVPARCFNPCSGGSASQTKPQTLRFGAAIFVSILVLVDRPLKQVSPRSHLFPFHLRPFCRRLFCPSSSPLKAQNRSRCTFSAPSATAPTSLSFIAYGSSRCLLPINSPRHSHTHRFR